MIGWQGKLTWQSRPSRDVGRERKGGNRMTLAITGHPNGSDGEYGPAPNTTHNIFLRGGELYEFQTEGIGLVDATLELRNGTGTLLAFDDDSGPGFDARIRFRPAACAPYFLTVRGFGG